MNNFGLKEFKLVTAILAIVWLCVFLLDVRGLNIYDGLEVHLGIFGVILRYIIGLGTWCLIGWAVALIDNYKNSDNN